MIAEVVKSITDEELRVKVAELLGWSREPGIPDRMTSPGGNWSVHIQSDGFPNYCKDLNAMHEVEKEIINDGCFAWNEYIAHLMTITARDKTMLCHATARQRAEAFIAART